MIDAAEFGVGQVFFVFFEATLLVALSVYIRVVSAKTPT